jgi:hypothetical protein
MATFIALIFFQRARQTLMTRWASPWDTTVEVLGALAVIYPGMASIGGLWPGFTMFCAVLTHLFVLHTNPAAAAVLGLVNVVIVYLHRDELVSFWRIITRQV